MSDHNETASLGKKITDLETKFSDLETKFSGLETKFSASESEEERIQKMLNDVDSKKICADIVKYICYACAVSVSAIAFSLALGHSADAYSRTPKASDNASGQQSTKEVPKSVPDNAYRRQPTNEADKTPRQ